MAGVTILDGVWLLLIIAGYTLLVLLLGRIFGGPRP